MARFQKQSILQSISNPGLAEADAHSSLARTMEGFKQFGTQQLGRINLESAEEDALEVAASTDAPELRSTALQSGRAYNKIVLAGHYAAVKNDYTQRILEMQDEHPNDPNMFKATSAAYKEEMLKTVSPRFREAVSVDYDAAVMRPFINVKKQHENEAIAESMQSIGEATNTYLESISKAARDGDVAGMKHNAMALEGLADSLDAMGKRKAASALREEMNNTVDKQLTLGQAQDAIDAGQGQAFIKNFISNPPPDLTPQQADSYAATMTTMFKRNVTLSKQAKAAESIEVSRAVSNLKIAATLGVGDPEKLTQEIEAAFEADHISGSERTSMLTKIFKKEQERQETADNQRRIATDLAGSDAIYVSTKDQNEYYDEVLALAFENMSPEQIELANVSFISRTKQVPKGLKHQLDKMVMSGNPDLIVQAAELVDKVDQIPGLVNNVFPAHTQAFMQTVNDLSANLSSAEAVKKAQELTDPANKARVESRERQLAEAQKGGILSRDLDYQDMVEQGMDDSWVPFSAPDLNGMSGDQITQEFTDLYDANFLAGMTKDKAQEEATKALKRNWGQHEGYVIKYPPKNYYEVAGSVDYMQDQLRKDVYTENWLPVGDESEIFLVGTEHTQKTASIGRPEYQVWAVIDGAPIVITAKGKNVYWRPDVEAEKARVSGELKAELDKTEALEKRVREGRERQYNVMDDLFGDE